MKLMKSSPYSFVLCATLLGTLTGCVVEPRHEVRVERPVVYVENNLMVQDDYVYYPGYQVYYSPHTRQYVYRDRNAWVTRPAPPRVSVEVLFASPSVKVNFRDGPAIHHSAVVQRYPKQWTPPESDHRK